LRPRYQIQVAITVMKSPPRPITSDMMASEEDMITPFKTQLAGFDLWRGYWNEILALSILKIIF